MEEVGLVVVLPPPDTLYRSWRVLLSTISQSLQSMMLASQSVNLSLLVSEMIQRYVYIGLYLKIVITCTLSQSPIASPLRVTTQQQLLLVE